MSKSMCTICHMSKLEELTRSPIYMPPYHLHTICSVPTYAGGWYLWVPSPSISSLNLLSYPFAVFLRTVDNFTL